MQDRTPGGTGIKVAPYALGAMMIATRQGNEAGDSIRIIQKALDSGINLVDTADAYDDRGHRRPGSAGASRQCRPGHQGRAARGRRPGPPGRLAPVDHESG